MSECVVLKLGGSVITEKDRPETVDEAALERAAAAVGEFDGELVVVHGGGSFGHHHASRLDVSRTAGTRDASAVRAIHDAMCRLNATVVETLADAGTPTLPVHPLSVGTRDGEGGLAFPSGAVAAMVEEGFVPVAHGDVVAHRGHGATVVSGDELVVSLARSLDADRVGLCSTVPGVLDESGEVVPTVERYDDVAHALGESAATDVTGGMAAKVRALLALEAPASVFGPTDVAAFLRGETPGTLVSGRESRR